MTTLTTCTQPIVRYPVKFLGATLISMSSKMGWGIDTSTLTVELVEDCVPMSGYNTLTERIEPFPADNFIGNDLEIVGAAAYFSLPTPTGIITSLTPNQLPLPTETGVADKFRFGGIITNWNTSLSSNGLTYSVTISDPKPILENTLIVLDSYSDLPFQHSNYYNVYAAYEAGANYGNCSVFGTADSTERGMNYNNALKGLLALAALSGDTTNYRLNVFSPTTNQIGYPGFFKLDLGYKLTENDIYSSDLSPQRDDCLPAGPNGYRIADKMSLLEFIENICNVTGRNFYTNLYWDPVRRENVIKVSAVQLTQPSGTIFEIVPNYQGYATDLTYGRELRNEKSRKLIFGEQIHYLLNATDFIPYFGEDTFGNPVYPIKNQAGNFCEPDGTTDSNCGFWINQDINSLNLSLYNPIISGTTLINKIWISEIDIRSALSSYDLWLTRTLIKSNEDDHYSKIVGSLVKTLQEAPVYSGLKMDNYLDTVKNVLTRSNNSDFNSSRSPAQDLFLGAKTELAKANEINLIDDLDKIHKFIANIGTTYYGKQFLTQLNNNICVTINNEEANADGFGEKIYSEVPTNDGGWVDYGNSVLGLNDPGLSIFRSDDDRIKPFAVFAGDASGLITSTSAGDPGRVVINPPNPVLQPEEEEEEE